LKRLDDERVRLTTVFQTNRWGIEPESEDELWLL